MCKWFILLRFSSLICNNSRRCHHGLITFDGQELNHHKVLGYMIILLRFIRIYYIIFVYGFFWHPWFCSSIIHFRVVWTAAPNFINLFYIRPFFVCWMYFNITLNSKLIFCNWKHPANFDCIIFTESVNCISNLVSLIKATYKLWNQIIRIPIWCFFNDLITS